MPQKGEARKEWARQYYQKNKEEILSRTRAYFLANPEAYKKLHKNRKLREHNLTQVEYDQKLFEQNGVCAICRKKDSRDLSIDHNHNCCSGEGSCKRCTRGLLCNKCNKKLAVVEDATFLEVAIAYLEKWKA